MLFISLDFAIFLPLVFLLYWFLNSNLKFQNLLIVVASYVFYGWWDWHFLSLIFFSTIVDYIVGIRMSHVEKTSSRKYLLYVSIFVNIGFLAFFKYYNFFLDSFIASFSVFGLNINASSLKIVLPVGISFYTFQTLSYTIDVYKRKLKPTTNFIAFAAFVSYFPQLVAGPIERATHLLPQFYSKRIFDYKKAVDGTRQILWGLFKKIVIADNCADLANIVFNNSDDVYGSSLLLGAIFFAFQIYGDFSGYSDISIGTSRLFGFNLMQNFAFPYFSRDIAEFWRRWHISLSTWFRDYVYIPLGGSRVNRNLAIRNTVIIFLVSGFWHGANWTFLFWGMLNAIYFIPLLLSGRNRNNLGVVADGKTLPNLKELFQMFITFGLTVFAWIFFRAENLTQSLDIITTIFSKSIFQFNGFDFSGTSVTPKKMILLLFLFVLIEWNARTHKHALEYFGSKWPKVMRYALYYLIIFSLVWFGGEKQQFIYFQF
ncbi:MBOAT family O-acyltransferase [Saccharicrinis aurantiacus]|uniref:MBOAT family O-acyltransferase n=1 Tax=Saccharicrinis aurantiacus TaxID=1849719 RepID=UPI002492F4A6|nr:MBOAT family O-acyltransferase [Saccharicrinis aurantiacus]